MDIKEILPTLSHAPITNLKEGKINNQDATLLLMFQSPDGISTSPEIIKQLQDWRDQPLAFTYLFNTCESGGYGYVGKNSDSTHNMVYGFTISPAGKYYSCTTRRRTYWYRAKRGQYKLTLEGLCRIAELQDQMI
jgi:hypothetical protein